MKRAAPLPVQIAISWFQKALVTAANMKWPHSQIKETTAQRLKRSLADTREIYDNRKAQVLLSVVKQTRGSLVSAGSHEAYVTSGDPRTPA